jgi:hypothetical protein
MLLLLFFFALATPAVVPSPVGTWVLTGGWTGSTITLAAPAQADEEDRIELVFEEGGRIT